MEKRAIILGIAMLFAAVLAISTASAEITLHFVPEDSSQPDGYCHNVTVEAWANITSDDTLLSGQFAIHYNDTCLDVVDHPVYGDPHGWGPDILPSWSSWNANPSCHGDGYEMIMFTFASPQSNTDAMIFNVTFHCNCTEYFVSPLNFSRGRASFGCPIEILNATDYNLYPDNTTLNNGTITCGTPPAPISVDIRADSITGNIFDVSSYSVNPGTVTEDGITINNQTAMGAMVVYCQENGINVNITMGYWGEYVLQIGNNASDYNYWCYAVDEVIPWVGGAAYDLSGGEFVHWYNCGLNYYTVLTTLNSTYVEIDDYLNATVTWKNATGTHPLNGASVYETNTLDAWGYPTTGTLVGTTGPDGNCTIQATATSRWYVYAEDPVHGSGQYNYPVPYYDCWGEVLVTVDAPDDCIPRQSQFTVDIKVDPNGLEVYSAQYVLSFDPTVLRAETQIKEPFLTADGNDSMVVINTVDNTAGETEYSETRKDTTVGVTDDGVLATITFTAIGDTGTSSYLNLSEVIVSDPDVEPLAYSITNDNIEICQNPSPVANATVYDDYNNVGSKYLCKVYFDASGSTDDSGITYYRWDFGDGDYGTGMLKEHVYTSWNWVGPEEPGDHYVPFNASLTVTDDTLEPETGTDTTYFDVVVYIAGDANGDGIVNILDASMIGLEWMNTCNPPAGCWRDTVYDGRADRADLNNDHVVNILDAVIVGTCWKHTAW